MLRILLFAILLPFLFSFTYCPPSNWSAIHAESDLEIYELRGGCDDVKNGINKEYVFFKFKNKSNNQITVTYSLELYYNNSCYTCNSFGEYTYTQTLQPNQELVGDCSNKDGLSVFAKMLDGASNTQLTNYEIKNLVINK